MRLAPTMIRRGVAIGLAIFVFAGCSRADRAPVPDPGSSDPGSDPVARTDPGTDPTADPTVDPGSDPAVDVKTAKLVFADTKMACDAGTCSAKAFSISTLRELHVYSLWPTAVGQHVELRKYYSPDGALFYQKLVASTSADSAEPQLFEPSESLPHTRTIQTVTVNADGEAIVWDYLPVGGTWITQHQIVGEWRVEIYRDKLSGTPDITGTFTLAKDPTG